MLGYSLASILRYRNQEGEQVLRGSGKRLDESMQGERHSLLYCTVHLLGQEAEPKELTVLEQSIRSMKILGPDKFSKEDIDAMRETLHESEWEGMKDRHLRQMTWEGCIGWKNIPDAEVVEHYQNIYGESSNLEIVQGEIVAKFNDIK